MAGPAVASPATEEAIEDRKKQRRRAGRRSRQGSEFGSPADADYSENYIRRRSFSGDDDEKALPDKASEVVFSSLPNMPVRAAAREGWTEREEVSLSSPQTVVVGGGKIHGSFPLIPSPFEERNRKKSGGFGKHRYFDPHWSEDAVHQALENSRAFKAVLRVNSYNRLEAYCTLPGVPVDILINGAAAQNRAVEGDVVAVMLHPVSSWMKLKGSSSQSCNFDSPVKSKASNNDEKGDDDVVKDELNEDCKRRSSFDQKQLKSGHDLCALISSFPLKRPTGRVLSIIEPSRRREAIVGFLSIKRSSEGEIVHLVPSDSRFPEMLIDPGSIPDSIKDKSIEKELLAARMIDWSEGSLLPLAQVIHVFGQGEEIKPQIGAILFENAICCADFSSESLSCLPTLPWSIPSEEIEKRKDLRGLCIFTIDPSSAVDLDDALSFEKIKDDVYQVGVHIADVSYFVKPDTALDAEAQVRSTSVYVLQHKLPMLPPLLSADLVSLLPCEDKLTVSITWEIDLSGNILSSWIGRSVIRSCCKMSYEDAQRIIDGCDSALSLPPLCGPHDWEEITVAVQTLHRVSETLKEKRLKKGAILLENAKVEVLLDEDGNPYDSILRQQMDSNFVVREFMLLANKTAAEIVSKAFPKSALLRRHPEPNLRKLREFQSFCSKHGFEMDTSSSGHFHLSLENIRERLKDNPILFELLVSHALRPMQLAAYFSTGDFREDEWAHYALGVPQYTHFTSPLRRYPDIIVHRMLLATLEAEDFYRRNGIEESAEFKDALAEKHGVPCPRELSEIAAYCNERKWASKQAEEAGKKVYVWAFLKRKEMLTSEARVIRLGPKFMSIYIHKLAIERRICYADVDGLEVEWLENTSTLVLHLHSCGLVQRKPNTLKDVALITDPSRSMGNDQEDEEREVVPAVLPLTLQPLSSIPVVLQAIGGEGKCPDIGVRLYLSSYFGV